MGEIIACANQKGGVGKTTTVVNLASYLARSGCRVLIVDLDPQGNATSGAGPGQRREVERSIYPVLVDGADAAGPDRAEPPSRACPSSRRPETSPAPRSSWCPSRDVSGASRAPSRPLRGEFDYVLLDCPPSLGLLTVNALTAADSVLIPIQCEYYALEGLGQLLATIELVRAHLNPGARHQGGAC